VGALWAFTGPPDDGLADTLARALTHRGRAAPARHTGARATIGVASPAAPGGVDAAGLVAAGAGLARAEGVAVAVAGRATRADPSIVTRIDTEGPHVLREVPGDWVLVADTGDRLLVARDGPGTRSVCWGRHRGRTIVAVEAKGVLAAGVPRTVDPEGLVQYLTFSFVAGPATALADVRELPAGHLLTIDLATGSETLHRWFRPEERLAADDDPASWVAPVRACVDEAVAARLPADAAEVGAFLSGGIDSSVVVAAAARRRRELGHPPVRTYAVHFGADHPNELSHARLVADAAGTVHTEVEARPGHLLERLRRMIWHLDLPIGDPVTVGNWALADRASADTGWILNGEGGDPVLGGPKNLPMLLAHWYPEPSDGADLADLRVRAYLATWQRAYTEVTALLTPDLLAGVDVDATLRGVVEPMLTSSTPPAFLNKLMVMNQRLKGAHLILPKVERMLGAHGLVPLSPLFDPALIELSFAMPPRAKLHDGREKWVLKEAYRDLVPAAVVDRPKSGMRVPVQWWFQGDLRRAARSMLSPRRVRSAGWFRPDRVRDVLRYRTGRDGLRIWMLLTLEMWRQVVVEAEDP
jgi:asparagine synthase (glutamine-hydrolysing)